MRDSVLFYRSFYESMKNIPDDDRLKVYDAIMEYSMNDIDPVLDGVSLAIFLLVKPQIDANNKRYASGCKPKKKQDVSKVEAKEKEKEKENVKEKDNTYTCAFEQLWTAYPRKKEKARAYKCYKARLNDGFSEDELLLAVKRYAEECKESRTEDKYIKLASTFLSSNTPFADYLGDYTPPKKKANISGFNNAPERIYSNMDELTRGLIE